MHSLHALEERLTTVLDTVNRTYAFPSSLICTEGGLLLASAGREVHSEIAAGLTSLFDDIALRAVRDLDLVAIDELTLVARAGQRYVIRPFSFSEPRLYLVVEVPSRKPWRQGSNLMLRQLHRLLEPFLVAVHAAE